MLGMAEGSEAEERVDRGESRVAAPYAVMSLALQMLQEVSDQGCSEVCQVELGRRLAGLLVGEGQQQRKAVALGGHGVGAGLALMDQPLREECFQSGG